MCIICEKGNSLATLHQILLRLEIDGNKNTGTYQYVEAESLKIKIEIDKIEEALNEAKESLKEIMVEWQQENSLFYPSIDDEKQALKN